MDEFAPAEGEDGLSAEEQQATLEFLSGLLQDSAMKHSQDLGKKYAPPPAPEEAPMEGAPVEGAEPELSEEEMMALLASEG